MKILLVGVGNLGQRYLEGLDKLKKKKVFFYDKNKRLLKDVQKLYQLKNKDFFVKNELKVSSVKSFDLCILATTASSRHNLVNEILKNYKIKFWILEKLVSNNINNFEKIYKKLKNKRAYVNLPRPYSKIHSYLKNKRFSNIKIVTSGGKWNIASNCIHHMHLLEWLTNEKIERITIDKKKFYKSKRTNFIDFYGTLTAYTGSGSKIILRNNISNKKFNIKINHLNDNWLINEHYGFLKKNSKFIIKKEFNYQSQITPLIVKSISNSCKLPSLNKIYDLHNMILKEFRKINLYKVT
jgi:hypothetical protein